MQENVSPTYAFPNSGGRVSSGERENGSLGADGYAKEADLGIEWVTVDADEGAGKVC